MRNQKRTRKGRRIRLTINFDVKLWANKRRQRDKEKKDEKSEEEGRQQSRGMEQEKGKD